MDVVIIVFYKSHNLSITDRRTDRRTIGYEVASLENETKITVFQNRKGKKEKGKVNKSDIKDRISFNKH